MIPLKSCVRCKCKYRNLPPPPLFVSILVEFVWQVCVLSLKFVKKIENNLRLNILPVLHQLFSLSILAYKKLTVKTVYNFIYRLIKNLQFVKRHGNHLFHSLNYNEVSFFDEFYDYLRTTSDFDHNFRGRIWWIVML